jgi:hypothetical protein
MPLISSHTNLKSLKYGNDRPGRGSSNQPYVTTPIPEGNNSPLSSQDFVLRGGLYAFKDTTEDIIRIGKYFTDTKNPSGLLFVAKQNLLSRLAVRTQTSGILNEGIYTPLSTLAQTSVVAFGGHLNKQGLNPFGETGAHAQGDHLYFNKVKPNPNDPKLSLESNRLVDLYKTKEIINTSNEPNILIYGGGPGSILGIGKTHIKFSDQRTGISNSKIINSGFIIDSTKRNYEVFTIGRSGTDRSDITFNGNNLLGVSINYSKKFRIKFDNGFNIQGQQNTTKNYGPQTNNQTLSTNPIDSVLTSNNSITYNQDEIINIETSSNSSGESFFIGKNNSTSKIGDFRKLLRNRANSKDLSLGLLSSAPNYTTKNIEERVKLGDPGDTKHKNLLSYVSGSGIPGKLGAASENSYDKINTLPLYKSADVDHNGPINDLVKFRIGVIDNDEPSLKTYIHFRAFLNTITDAYSSEQNSTKYIGRGENFYTYGGFDRKVSLSWTVAAQSKAELIPMYKKLNYLASVCTPDYSKLGYMRGNIVTLTIGGYFYEQPGIITGFSYEMNDDNATWEIGIPDSDISPFTDPSVKELPHLIKVSGFNFIPIHDFVPRLVQNIGLGTKEKYIALSNGEGNNYN